MTHLTPLPGSLAPMLSFSRLGGGYFDLAEAKPDRFTVVFFYRGVHCPKCRTQLEELNGKLDAFGEVGADVLAVSMDGEDRAKKQAGEWAIDKLDIGYALTEVQARDWGLFISRSIREGEPERFCEPGIAVVTAADHIQMLFLQNTPFARPQIDDILSALRFINEKNYPIRGTLDDGD